MRLAYLSCLLFLPLLSFGQKGTIYLKNYEAQLSNISASYNDIVQLPSGDILLANDNGLIIYNGTFWKRVLTDDKPKVLFQSLSEDLPVFIGNKNSFGTLSFNSSGQATYQYLIDTLPEGLSVLNIIEDQDFVYFHTASALYNFNKKEQILSPKPQKIIEGLYLFSLEHRVYAIQDNKLFMLQKDSLLFQKSIEFSGNIVADIPWSSNEVLLLTRKGKFFIFDGSKLKSYSTSADNYFESNYVTNGIAISELYVAISTLSGGMVLIEKNSGEAIQFINYQTGLPDDEVNSMCADNQDGIWLCHGLGLSRADINLPISEFSQFPGLAGDISCIRKLGERIYVGTNEGLFYLSKVENIKEVDFLIKKEKNSRNSYRTYRQHKTIERKVRVTLEPQDTAHFEPLVKEIPFTLSVPFDSVVNEMNNEFSDELSRREYALQSIPFTYKKIAGLEGRCNQLLIADSSLLVATNMGLIHIQGTQLQYLIAEIKINQINRSAIHKDIYYAAGDEGIFLFRFENNNFELIDQVQINYAVNSIAEGESELIIGAENKLFSIRLQDDMQLKEPTPLFESSGDILCLNILTDSLLFVRGNSVMKLSRSDTTHLSSAMISGTNLGTTENLVYTQPGLVWLYSENEWMNFSIGYSDHQQRQFLNLFQDVRDIFVDTERNLWMVQDTRIYRISRSAEESEKVYQSRIAIVRDRQNNELGLSEVDLKYNNNSLFITLATPFYLGEDATQYRYKLDQSGYSWTPWSNNPEISIQYLEPGSYSLLIQSKNVLGQTYQIAPLRLKISPPFWRSWWFIMLSVLSLIVLVRLIILYRTKALERENRILQQKVKEATIEILTQKEHIEKLYKNIRSSINYAERIQRAILPKKKLIQSVLPESFLLFKPQDVVSGDFYWFHNTDDYFIMIATDCTGHGVPGAFMSMIGNTLLNQIVKEEGITDPASILYRLDKDVIASLQQDQENRDSLDGMDLAICTYFKKDQELHYGGAMNSLYLFQKSGFTQITADLNPVGGVYANMEKEFTTHKIKLESDATVYIFSDGYYDQLGGAGQRIMKFNSGRFRESLMNIYTQDFARQKEILNQNINDWLGERKQNDDILVIGFKIRTGD